MRGNVDNKNPLAKKLINSSIKKLLSEELSPWVIFSWEQMATVKPEGYKGLLPQPYLDKLKENFRLMEIPIHLK